VGNFGSRDYFKSNLLRSWHCPPDMRVYVCVCVCVGACVCIFVYHKTEAFGIPMVGLTCVCVCVCVRVCVFVCVTDGKPLGYPSSK